MCTWPSSLGTLVSKCKCSSSNLTLNYMTDYMLQAKIQAKPNSWCSWRPGSRKQRCQWWRPCSWPFRRERGLWQQWLWQFATQRTIC
jgi:hypothetical protein